jgi:hypothetical protein
VSGATLWWLHRIPYYQEGLPYIYDLGGPALVAWYSGLGLFSLGLYIVMDWLIAGRFHIKSLRRLFIGEGILILAFGLGWLYLILLEMSVRMS